MQQRDDTKQLVVQEGCKKKKQTTQQKQDKLTEHILNNRGDHKAAVRSELHGKPESGVKTRTFQMIVL